MNKRTYLLTFVVAASFLLSTPASADTVLYNNGPVDVQGGLGSFGIYWNYIMSDSFTLTGTSTLKEVDLGLWVHHGETPSSLYWSITDSAPSTNVGISDLSGTKADLTMSSTALGTVTFNMFGADYQWDIYESSFSLPADYELGPGTHYLTLYSGQALDSTGQADGGGSLFWDITNGPSVALQNGWDVGVYDDKGNLKASNSDSFQILGIGPTPPPTVPEGGASLLQLGIGLAGLAGFARRKLKA